MIQNKYYISSYNLVVQNIKQSFKLMLFLIKNIYLKTTLFYIIINFDFFNISAHTKKMIKLHNSKTMINT